MYCVHQGKVCIQVWNPRRSKWVYIQEKVWSRMDARARARYIID